MTTPSKSQQAAADISALFRARNPLIWIKTTEEARVEGFVAEAAAAAGYLPRVWDVAQGVATIDGKKDSNVSEPGPDKALDYIRDKSEKGNERGVWIMRDLAPWLQGAGGMTTLRQVRNLARSLPGVPRERAQAIVVLAVSAELPPELANHASVIEWPLPDRAEIAAVLDAAINSLPEVDKEGNKLTLRENAAPNGVREAAIDAAVGLSGEEAAACYARSLVQLKKIDPSIVSNEKKRIIARERVLEWFDPLPGGLEAVGGLENIKSWLVGRTAAYSAKAREYGLPAPKGALVVGQSGCGKSLLSKAIATAWGVPLLRLDLGALKSKYVGESEGNLRKALRVIEAIGRCVVWVDEVEKSLQGATSGSADGGVSADALGALLTWMEERKGGAFVIATANDVSALPPEFLRKGRFDDVWFVDLPTQEERIGVLTAALKANGRGALTERRDTNDRDAKIDLAIVAEKCAEFTGAEIASLVPDALFAAFADNAREIETRDLLASAKTVVPLSKTAETKIKALREWAATRARPASCAVATTTTAKREFDI